MAAEPSDLESWFDDVGAPEKVLEFLTSDDFPLSLEAGPIGDKAPSVLDLGTGNGSMLFTLRLDGGYDGLMVGVDYSQQSIELARKLWKQYSMNPNNAIDDGESRSSGPTRFEVVDLIREDPRTEDWWPKAQGGFDLVLDKGTFDAISLSSETIADAHGEQKRICELYPRKAIDTISPEGYLLVTSCNWTEEEVVRWFTRGEGVEGRLEVYSKIKYPVYEFGGQKGQGVASVCFKKRKGA